MSKHRSKKRRINKENFSQVRAINPISKHDFNDPQDKMVILPFDVLKMIFKHLLAKDLNNSAMVCRLWQDAAESEIERRSPVIKMFSWKQAFKEYDSKNHFSNYLTAKPMLGLLFNAADAASLDSMGKYVPQDCVTVSINNKGIVFNEEEHEDACENCLMTYLPAVHYDIEIEYIMETSKYITHFNKDLVILHKGPLCGPKKINIDALFQDSFDRLKEVKCIIFLASENSKRGIRCIQMNSFTRYSNVLWGGIASSVTLCKRNNKKKSASEDVLWSAILISGSNVKSWSTVIDSNMIGKVLIEEKLIEMKKSVETLRHTVGFMYSCVGRGENFHSEKHLESSLFKKVFPKIPLVGCFGGGEFGTTTVGDKPNTRNKIHQYSTVFMILTYGI